MVGNAAVSAFGLSNKNTLILQDYTSIPAYRELAERIRWRTLSGDYPDTARAKPWRPRLK
jgi:hypothetical protein